MIYALTFNNRRSNKSMPESRNDEHFQREVNDRVSTSAIVLLSATRALIKIAHLNQFSRYSSHSSYFRYFRYLFYCILKKLN